MKRIASLLGIFALCGWILPAGAQRRVNFKNVSRVSLAEKRLSKMIQLNDLKELNERLAEWLSDHGKSMQGTVLNKTGSSTVGRASTDLVTERVWTDDDTGLPFFVSGLWSESGEGSLAKATAEAKAIRYLDAKKGLMGLRSPGDEFRVRRVVEDALGETHVRLQQVYNDLEIWGRDIVVHMDVWGTIRGFNGRYVVTPTELTDLAERISPDEAVRRIRIDSGKEDMTIDACDKKIYILESGTPVLVWHVIVRFDLWRWYYFIDAKTGDVVHKIDYTMTDGPTTGTAVDLAGGTQTVQLYKKGAQYYLVDCSKPMFNDAQSDVPDIVAGGIMVVDVKNQELAQNAMLYYMVSADPNTWPANAVSMETSVSRVYDYYRDKHNRNSIDDKGMTVYSIINLNQDYNNAFWNGYFLCFGNGDGVEHSDICGAFDVIGHEYTHGVTQHTSNLVYENQSGALNEAMSDIFGALCEWHYQGANGDWLIAEDTYTPAIGGDAMRDMADPSGPRVQNKLPATMSEFRTLPNTQAGDWGGVHVNCSIVSRAAVLIAQNCDADPAAGRGKMGRIFYRAQTVYLTQSSQFIDARVACVQAAQDIFGAGSAEEQAVRNAFDTVEIFDGNPTPPPPDYPKVEGDEWVIVKGIADGALYRCSTDGSVIDLLTATVVGNRPAVSDDGSFIVFVDGNNDLIGINSDGTGEMNLTADTIFEKQIRSVAVSPNEQYVSFTSIYEDATIYFLDLVNATDFSHPLYSPITKTDMDPVYDVLYADAMDWDFDNNHLLYDCYHESPTVTGGVLGYWSINLMRVSDGTIYNIFPYQPQGVSVGNPVFASTNDYVFAYDYLDSWGNTAIYAANLETGDEGIIMANNFGMIGYPSYNPSDNRIVFHSSVQNQLGQFVDGIGQIQLETDKINGVPQTAAGYLTNATYPVWFAVGTRSDAEDDETPLPLAAGLGVNFPNPFNPETTIPFQIVEATRVRLVVFNLKGEELAILKEGRMVPGQYRVRWAGIDRDGRSVPSGVYVYRLEMDDRTMTRKMVLVR